MDFVIMLAYYIFYFVDPWVLKCLDVKCNGLTIER